MNKSRRDEIVELIKRSLGPYVVKIEVLEHRVRDSSEYIKLRVLLHQGIIEIREFMKHGERRYYAYYADVRGRRFYWNNEPHHPEVSTFPHHEHENSEIRPLERPTLDAFLEKVKRILVKE